MMPKMKMRMKRLGRMNLIFEFSIFSICQFSWKSGGKIDPFFKTFLTNRGKNEIINEKIWENEFDLWILHIKVRLYSNFYENLWKKNFDQFFRTLLTNPGKNEIEDEKYEKMNSIFEFSISKLGYVAVFMEISEKNLEKWVQFLNSPYQN